MRDDRRSEQTQSSHLLLHCLLAFRAGRFTRCSQHRVAGEGNRNCALMFSGRLKCRLGKSLVFQGEDRLQSLPLISSAIGGRRREHRSRQLCNAFRQPSRPAAPVAVSVAVLCWMRARNGHTFAWPDSKIRAGHVFSIVLLPPEPAGRGYYIAVADALAESFDVGVIGILQKTCLTNGFLY